LLHEIVERRGACHGAKLGRIVGHGLQRLGWLAEEALLAIFILGLKCCGLHSARQTLERLEPADCWYLRNDTFDAAIVCGHLESVTAGIAGAEDADPRLVDVRPRVDVGDCIAITSSLQRRVDLLPRLSAGITKIDVVIGQHRKAAAREVLRVLHDRALFHARHARSHDDRGQSLPLALGGQQNSLQEAPTGREFDVRPFNLEVVLVVKGVAAWSCRVIPAHRVALLLDL
jgi:hypothetical protein